MRLKLNKTLRAALIAAITTVGLTLTQAQAADITLANVMNQGIDADTAATTTVWGDTDSILGTVSAQYHITNGGQNPTQTNYTQSFLATKTNVGTGGTYTYTLTFTTAETLANPVTLSSINVDFITFNGGGVGHNQGGPTTTRSTALGR